MRPAGSTKSLFFNVLCAFCFSLVLQEKFCSYKTSVRFFAKIIISHQRLEKLGCDSLQYIYY